MLTYPPWRMKVRKTIPNVNVNCLQPCVHGKEEHHLPVEQLDADRPPWKVKVRKTIPNVNAIILQPCVHGKEEHHLPGEQSDADRPLMEGEGEKDYS